MTSEKHQEILKILDKQIGTEWVKDLFESPNRYGDTVSSFTVKHSVRKDSYSKTDVKVYWTGYSKPNLFITNKGYFEFLTPEEAETIIEKQIKFK